MELFKNPEQALLFSFRFSGEQYPQSELARMMKRTGSSSGKGLVGLDGAAQAGMIQSRLERLDELQRACIVARYADRAETCQCCGGPKPREEYRAAIEKLGEWALQFLSGTLSVRKVRYAIVQDYFERRRSVGKIAEEVGVPKRTAYDQKAKIWAHLSDLDKTARTVAGDALADLCGDVDQ